MSHSIDFFAVVGRKEEEKLNCTKVSSLWDENQKSSLVDVWNDAITDIALVTEYNRDSIDDSWTIITESTDGVEFMDLDVKICLAYRRRRESKKIDHISQVIILIFNIKIFSAFYFSPRSVVKIIIIYCFVRIYIDSIGVWRTS